MRFLKSWLPVIIWAAVILSAANDRFSTHETAGWIKRLLGFLPPLLNFTVRKAAHMFEYSILALLAWRAHRTVLVPLAIVVLVASIDETLQAQTLTRTGSPFDVVLDTAAALLALIALPAVRERLSSRRNAA